MELARTTTKLELTPRLKVLAAEMRENSERWFPELHDGTHDMTVFYTLGLAGEAGEVANVVKKMNRGVSFDIALHAGLAAELADVFTYLLLLAGEVGIDLIEEYDRKRVYNDGRWGHDVPASFREACVIIVNEKGGASSVEVAEELTRRGWYPLCTVIDVADELKAHFG